MIRYAALREQIQRWPKYAGCQRLVRAPLITPAFPGTFNMSFTEHHWLAEFGAFLDWDHDFIFTAVQSCVRLADFAPLAAASTTHLGVFELADLCGAIALRSAPDHQELQHWQIAELLRLLGDLGIAPEQVHVSYAAGGPIAELTAGHYALPNEIPPDQRSYQACRQARIPAANLIEDRTRATLLALHVHRPTPWGYRNEFFVDIGSTGNPRLVEVATAEYFLWRPVFSGVPAHPRNLVGLEALESGATLLGVGLERLAMVANGLARIQQVDYLEPFYQALAALLQRPLTPTDYLAGEGLRVLHRVYADLELRPAVAVEPGQSPVRTALSAGRRKKLASLKRRIPTRFGPAELEQLLLAHSLAQPWHPELNTAIGPTIEAISKYRQSPASDLISAD